MPNLSKNEYLELLIPLLRNNPAFTDLSNEEIYHLADAAEFRSLEQGARLIEQGDRGDEFFVVLSGQLRALDMRYDPPHLLNYHDTGHIIGTRALLHGEPRAATVEVVIEAQVAVYDRQDWEWLIHRQSRIEAYFEDIEREFEQRSLMDFPGRQWDEVVVASTKRHVLVLIARLSFPLSLLIIPILLLIAFELLGVDILSATPGNQLFEILAVLPFLALAVMLIVYDYVDWSNDDFILTTKRFIHIERKLLYGEQRDEAPLTRIQDVSLAYPGFLDRFDYHDLRIKTAGAGVILINGITKAERMQNLIFQEKELAMARVRAANMASIRHQLAQQLKWQDALTGETILAIAEEEGSVSPPIKQRRLSRPLNYLWPRLEQIETDNTTITWRKHYWVLFRAVSLPFVGLLLTSYACLASVVGWIPFGAVAGPLTTALLLGLTLACAVWYLWRYDGWRRDIYQVTETRVVDVTSSPFGLSGELRNEGSLEDIQNITYNIPGFFSRLLNMGSVIIETAGTGQTFNFKQVFNPSMVQQEIFNRMVHVQQKEREQRRDENTRDLMRMFTEYQSLLEKATTKGLVKLDQPENTKPKT